MTFKHYVVFWHGFPACAHMLRDFSNILGEHLYVIATKPKIPYENLGNFLSNKVIYINEVKEISRYWDLISSSKCFIHTGWCYKDINRIDKKIKKLNYQTKIIVLVDNRLKYSLRQFIAKFIYKYIYSKYYDGYIVAGVKSRELLNYFGVIDSQISYGHYGAPEDFFPRNYNLFNFKKNQFIFVGSLDKRKGFDILINGWKKYKLEGGDWNLVVVGNGSLEHIAYGVKDVYMYGFRQPFEVAGLMRESKVLVLPGRDDNWATVLAEGAASGCLLLSSVNVGATFDLIEENKNGFILPKKYSIENFKNELIRISKIEKKHFEQLSNYSIKKSEEYTSKRFTNAVEKLTTCV